MMVAIIGGKGSGKSTTAVKLAIQRNNYTLTNFDIRKKNNTRLKLSHIITEDKKVNYGYWNSLLKKYGGYDIFIDEIHNIAHSRRFMSNINVQLSKWMSQIRKILGDSEKHDLYMISQNINRIDSSFRDLLDVIIYCQKVTRPERIETVVRHKGKFIKRSLFKTYVMMSYFRGEHCMEKFNMYLIGHKSYDYRAWYFANPYFKYFDSYEMIQMQEEEFL